MMPTCPQCTQSELEPSTSLELYPEAFDEITLIPLNCPKGDFYAVRIYEESRRGRLDSESVNVNNYSLSQKNFAELQQTISQCPDPKNIHCKCESHLELNRKYKNQEFQKNPQVELE